MKPTVYQTVRRCSIRVSRHRATVNNLLISPIWASADGAELRVRYWKCARVAAGRAEGSSKAYTDSDDPTSRRVGARAGGYGRACLADRMRDTVCGARGPCVAQRRRRAAFLSCDAAGRHRRSRNHRRTCLRPRRGAAGDHREGSPPGCPRSGRCHRGSAVPAAHRRFSPVSDGRVIAAWAFEASHTPPNLIARRRVPAGSLRGTRPRYVYAF